jgi:hypothetical protein
MHFQSAFGQTVGERDVLLSVFDVDYVFRVISGDWTCMAGCVLVSAVLHGEGCYFGCFGYIDWFHLGVITWVACCLFAAVLVGCRLRQCIAALLQRVGCVGSVI